MNPNLQAIVQFLMQALSPSEASAEMIPTSPYTKDLLQKGLQTPGKQGDIIRQAHARPEKVNITDDRTLLQALLGQMTMGNYTTGPMGGQNIQLNRPLLDLMSQRTGKEQAIPTLAHEAGHFVAQNQGQGGNIAPTGIAPLDYILRALLAPVGQDLRLPVQQNEALANKLAGLD
jgi:hypothetical protein